jgi:hypothetical protein
MSLSTSRVGQNHTNGVYRVYFGRMINKYAVTYVYIYRVGQNRVSPDQKPYKTEFRIYGVPLI